jgi:hypothetical protein
MCRVCVGGGLTLALPDQDQAEGGQCRAVPGPLDLVDHEARLRPCDRTGALTDPEQPESECEEANDQKRSAQWVFSFAIRPGGLSCHRGHGGALVQRGQGQGSPEELEYKAAKYRQGARQLPDDSPDRILALAEELGRQAHKARKDQ